MIPAEAAADACYDGLAGLWAAVRDGAMGQGCPGAGVNRRGDAHLRTLEDRAVGAGEHGAYVAGAVGEQVGLGTALADDVAAFGQQALQHLICEEGGLTDEIEFGLLLHRTLWKYIVDQIQPIEIHCGIAQQGGIQGVDRNPAPAGLVEHPEHWWGGPGEFLVRMDLDTGYIHGVLPLEEGDEEERFTVHGQP